METFMGRVNARLDTLFERTGGDTSSLTEPSEDGAVRSLRAPSTPIQHEAPVLLIRDAAADIGIRSPEQTMTAYGSPDIISKAIISTEDVYDLLCL